MGGSESKVVHHGPMRKWDWGDYSTAFAEKILLEHAANSGEFIVRRSKKLKGYCISVLVNRDGVCACTVLPRATPMLPMLPVLHSINSVDAAFTVAQLSTLHIWPHVL
jgi:hypothetical protein